MERGPRGIGSSTADTERERERRGGRRRGGERVSERQRMG